MFVFSVQQRYMSPFLFLLFVSSAFQHWFKLRLVGNTSWRHLGDLSDLSGVMRQGGMTGQQVYCRSGGLKVLQVRPEPAMGFCLRS